MIANKLFLSLNEQNW